MKIYHYAEVNGNIFIFEYDVKETDKMYIVTDKNVIKGDMANDLLLSWYSKNRLLKSSIGRHLGEAGRCSLYTTENNQDDYLDFIEICLEKYEALQTQKQIELEAIDTKMNKLKKIKFKGE